MEKVIKTMEKMGGKTYHAARLRMSEVRVNGERYRERENMFI